MQAPMSVRKDRDLMTTQLVTLKPDDTVKKAVLKFALDNISGAPVIDGRSHLLGILSQNDVLRLVMATQDRIEREHPDSEDLLVHSMDSVDSNARLKELTDEISNKPVSEVMTRTVLTTTPDETIINVLRSMMDLQVNRLPVLEKGVVVGVISRDDIIFSLYKRKV